MTARFSIADLPGDPPRVEKRGDAAALAREADALARLAGRPWVPALVGHAPGRLVTERAPGAPRPLAALVPADARRLGAVLRELHESRRAPAGGVWWWESPATDLGAYRAGRIADAEAALRGTGHEGLALAAAAAAGTPPPDALDAEPFRMLHGDLVADNIVWSPSGPVLIDWEFGRLGDPAEDLAYLAELNALPAAVAASVLEGYGLPGMAERVESWRGLVAADAAGWYLAEGMDAEAAAMLARGASGRGSQHIDVLGHGEKPRGDFSYLCPKPPPPGQP